MNQNISAILLPYQQRIEVNIQQYRQHFKGNPKLVEALGYALSNGGKRFRPVLTHLIAYTLNPDLDVSLAALAIEFFHTASLIADDLPCMDNEEFRREKPSLHRVYGEDVAILVSYALISEGYECIVKNGNVLKESLPNAAEVCLLAIENASFNTGLKGATGGQYLDLYPQEITTETVEELICKKTVSLFEISFVFGWLFGGGDMNRLPAVKEAAYHFGMAFQIADDIDDLESDLKSGRKANFALAYGKNEALKRLDEETILFLKSLYDLDLHTPQLSGLLSLLKSSLKHSA